jgi:hypothetical protein
MTSIFYDYDDLPTAADVEAVAEVTILAEGAADGGVQFGIGRVDRAIKGPIGNTIKIITVNSDCQHPFSIGDHGIVMGPLRKNRGGEIELLAKSETQVAKEFRKKNRIITK